MATIKEIAKLAGVSAVTVSNVLNGKGGAGEAKTLLIKELAAQLHYTPNMVAKNLKRKRTNTVGIITEDLTVFNTPEIVDGIDACCEENGFSMLIGNMRLFKRYSNDFTDTGKHHQLFDSVIESLRSKQVEGIVYVGYHCREIPYLPAIKTLPFVYAYCFASDPAFPSVIYDDEKAAYDLTDLIIRNGHSKIGILCGPFTSFHTQARLRGFQQCLFDHGILYNSRLTLFGNWERQAGYELGGRLVKEGATAVFCLNDVMASGLYDYCSDHGLQVGRDISLAGFDNQEISQALKPQLTTVAPPLFEIGRKAAQIIIDRVTRNAASADHCKLPCHLIERGSIADIRPEIG